MKSLKTFLLGWLGVGNDQQDYGPIGRAQSDAGPVVSPQKALSLSAVWSCTRLVSQTIATLPLGLYERMPDGSRKLADGAGPSRVISVKANADMTAVTFWECIISQALLLGNGFAEKKRIGQRIVSLELLSSDRLTWRRLIDGSYEFRYIDKSGKSRIIPESNIFHIPGFTMWGKFGMSVIRYGAQVFGSAIAGNQAANSTFKNGLMPTTYFKMDRDLTKNQREEFRENKAALRGSLNAGKQPLLEGGMDVGEMGINPDDAQLLESRVFSIEEVCRWFGVPPSMIGSTDKASSWASSAESLNLWFLQYGLRPWLKRIEQAIHDSLLTPAEQQRYYAEFSVEGLLRTNTAGRTAFYTSALQNGWMNRNEVRLLENLPPVDGGEIYTAQSNLLPLDKLGSTTSPQEVMKAWLGIHEGESNEANQPVH